MSKQATKSFLKHKNVSLGHHEKYYKSYKKFIKIHFYEAGLDGLAKKHAVKSVLINKNLKKTTYLSWRI